MTLFLVFFNYFIWSTSFTLGKSALTYSSPLFLTGTRMLFAGLILLGFVIKTAPQKLRLTKKQILPLLLLAFVGFYLSNIFEFWGLQYLTAAKTCFIYSLSPFFAALFSYLQFKEKISTKKMLGIVIGFLGFLPMFITQSPGEKLLGGFSFFSWAEISLVLATATAAYSWILLRKLGKEEKMAAPVSNGYAMLCAGTLALLHSLFTESWNPLPVSKIAPFSRDLLLMIVASNLICYNLHAWLLKRFTATFLSFAGLTTPLFASFFGWIILRETVSPILFLSLGIVSFGLWLTYAEELRLGYIVKNTSS